ncbi:MAG: hypothetical protein CMM30_06980 [Rhodospirillaceae bacterium]|nr:hypothetical protein [Rhodospirillaceae bacterium]|tara:strand:+ start:371 stop:580 length:210 start_codon:yes stop_codon:yes gene_type:complete
MKTSRKIISKETITGIADELADFSLNRDEIDSRSAVMEGILENITSLRDLPLKDIEPALLYKPIKSKKG